jgi:choline kinase
MFHILPAAGNASRIGGIPKFLLPIGINSKTLLDFHIETALQADLQVIIVVNPLLEAYIQKLIENAGYKKVRVVSYKSNSMSDSLVKAVENLDDEFVASVTMPDSYMPEFTSETLIELRKKTPSLSVIKTSNAQYSKLGQVVIDKSKKAIEIRDKSPVRISPYAWTGFAIKIETLKSFPCDEQTPGIQLARMTHKTQGLRTIEIQGEYFDCGTIFEYWQALGKSIGE